MRWPFVRRSRLDELERRHADLLSREVAAGRKLHSQLRQAQALAQTTSETLAAVEAERDAVAQQAANWKGLGMEMARKIGSNFRIVKARLAEVTNGDYAIQVRDDGDDLRVLLLKKHPAMRGEQVA